MRCMWWNKYRRVSTPLRSTSPFSDVASVCLSLQDAVARLWGRPRPKSRPRAQLVAPAGCSKEGVADQSQHAPSAEHSPAESVPAGRSGSGCGQRLGRGVRLAPRIRTRSLLLRRRGRRGPLRGALLLRGVHQHPLKPRDLHLQDLVVAQARLEPQLGLRLLPLGAGSLPLGVRGVLPGLLQVAFGKVFRMLCLCFVLFIYIYICIYTHTYACYVLRVLSC